ncbi:MULTISPECIES: Dps family protein [unclassified Flavobacterium]|jgi:starvation-inducible DNA-binding protein|uniref:Dps family protein n=1 Tax=unclassified Flavobacterium TaxID=196869 RepID=UPI00057DA499|nr:MULTISPECIES: DNA starvation/stationary phase protection protein [unclassified Flavobacterium]KIC00106.1 Dps family ferritin [Flavobacterium sp. KMS]KIC02802.1 Dps family ferritin [Flavobacterium sp. JRM]MEA9411916.1 DNA starvation/stationary phase protection protein [Flavobacterium sp. PL02]OUL62741.1 DNA starvation/stationary phase protection protein [Flavobacterium sp. AJR]
MKPNIGIAPKDLKKSADILTSILSNEMILYVKTRKFHWNISGNSFMELHKLFEDQYGVLETIIDEVAERINQLGEKTIGTMTEFIGNSTLKEFPNKYPSQKEMLSELLENHEQVITEFRKYIPAFENENHDIGSADFITGLLEQHEKMSWILRRYLS